MVEKAIATVGYQNIIKPKRKSLWVEKKKITENKVDGYFFFVLKVLNRPENQ
jgi:hypothetical protein